MGEYRSPAGSFLSLFFEDEVSENDRFALWTKHNKRHIWCQSVADAETFVRDHSDRDTYFSVGLYPKGVTKRHQENVSCIFGVWLDIDCGDKGNGQEYFPSPEDAMEWVQSALAGMWTIIVHSGRGLHLYLMFDEPFWIGDETDRIRARTAVKAFHSWASSQCKYHLDPVIDLSRIMRLPGTKNTASGNLCHVIDVCDTRIALSDLLERLPDVSLAVSGHVAGLDGDVDPEDVKRKIALMCQIDATFADTWNRKRRFKDNSPSGYCLSLANQLVASGMADVEVMAALQMWRAKELDAGDKPPEWYAMTIAKARSARADDVAETKFDNALSQALCDTDDKLKECAATEVFGRPLLRILKVAPPPHKGHVDSVSYRLEFEGGGVIKVPSTDSLLSQAYMRSRLFEDLGILMRRMKPAQYDKMLQILLTMIEVEHEEREANTAFNYEQELRMFIETKIEQCEVVDNLTSFKKNNLYRDEEGYLYFSWPAFKMRLAGVGLRPTNRELAAILKEIGSEAKYFGDVRLWKAPDGMER